MNITQIPLYNKLPKNVTRAIGKSVLTTRKYSPEVLTGLGIAGVVTAAVMACRASMRVNEITYEAGENIQAVKDVWTHEKEMDTPAYTKDLAHAYIRGGVQVAKLYAPSVTLGVLSISCIVGGQGILRKRNVALAAAYKALETSAIEYKKRVEEEFGKEALDDINHGIVVEEVEDEDGKTKEVSRVDPSKLSPYARFFDEANPEWQKNAETNKFFLSVNQTHFNDLLQSRGYVFLNEVYKQLGFKETAAGQLVGWFYDEDGDEGDNYIDFGMYDFNNDRARQFVNGYERSILLDFNVDGVIYDKLDNLLA